jgi:hypothetical protein
MDNMLGRQGKTRRFDRFAWLARAAEIVKMPVEIRPRSIVDCPIHSAAAEKRRVCSVDNGVNFLKDYTIMENFNYRHHVFPFRITSLKMQIISQIAS